MKSKSIFLDLDDTILDFHRSESEALRKTLTASGVTPTDEMVAYYSKVNDSQWKLLEKGELTRDEVLTRRFEIFFQGIGIERPALETRRMYEKNLSESAIFLPGAEELLKELSQDYRLFLASNGTATVQDGRIARSGIAKYFEKIFISERIGYNKPDKRFFDYCFDHIPDLRREDTVIIGDSLTSDIQGGKNAGITTVWYNAHNGRADHGIVPDYEVTSLDMIPLVAEMLFAKEDE